MKVFFRVDSSLKIGTGHVMRCLTLAQVLKENGANVEFICRKHEGNLIDKIRSIGFHVNELEVLDEIEVDDKLAHSHWLGATQQQDADDCIDIFKAEKSDWLVVDHYALDEQWEKRLKPYYEELMVIDDLADRKHQCDVLLDQTFGRQPEDYCAFIPEGCKLLLGPQYALLRPEFSNRREYSLMRRTKPEFKQLLVNMGGVDIDNITEKIVRELKSCVLPNDIKIVIVMGGSAPHLEDVRIKADFLPYKAEVKVDVDNMAEIMADSDMAIGAAGSTTWERCCLGLPTIQLLTADNQKTVFKFLSKGGIVKDLNSIEELPKCIEEFKSKLGSSSLLSSKVCDGFGVNRVMQYLGVR
jgi:UDP-2,4-diacetamido-2,4,6-trideoxy-beta-L-altropyranose hydrolase